MIININKDFTGYYLLSRTMNFVLELADYVLGVRKPRYIVQINLLIKLSKSLNNKRPKLARYSLIQICFKETRIAWKNWKINHFTIYHTSIYLPINLPVAKNPERDWSVY